MTPAPLPQPVPPPNAERDGVEEGKRLIRVAGATGLSLAERLSERLNRLTWRTPLHALRLRGRYPLKLIAVPDDPIPGDVRRGRALLDWQVSFAGETRDIGELNWAKPDWDPRFGDHLHGFGWLRDLSTVATRADGAPIAEALTGAWLMRHGDTVDGAWRPDLWGRRILAWTAHAPLILSSTDLVYRSKVLNTLARGARHLERGADKVPAGVPRIAAWCGVVTAGLLIPGGDPRLRLGEAGLGRALASGMSADGGIVSRSPAALLELVELLACVRGAYAARRMDWPDAVQQALARAVPALLATVAADRGLGSWQGGAPVSAERVAAAIAASEIRARPLRQSRDWGYQRLVAGSAVLVMDAAPPPVGRATGAGCASTLAFELSDGAVRLVVNCGGAHAAVVQLPRAIADGLRSSAAHSTLVVADTNSTATHPDGTLGRGVAEVELARQESDTGSRIEASHDGYLRRFGFRHRRQLMLGAEGRELRGEDALLPDRRRRIAATGFAVRFHLGPGVEAASTADGQGAILRGGGGMLWQFRCRGAAVAIEESLWIDGAGRPVATQQIVATGEAAAGGTSISWAFKRAA